MEKLPEGSVNENDEKMWFMLLWEESDDDFRWWY